MLRKLSLRNAKRQYKDYTLYLITLIGAVSFMFAFNSLIFSDNMKDISELQIMPYFIFETSILIILVLGWLVRYMNKYMLRRRSKELSIYMVSGIPSKSISKMLFWETVLIGIVALVIGILFGLLLAQLLEAVLCSVFGRSYHLNFQISLPTVGLTFAYFAGIFLFAHGRNKKWIRKKKLYDFLYYDKQNEERPLHGKLFTLIYLILTLLSGLAGAFIMISQPFKHGFSALIGLSLLVLFIFGLFHIIPSLLAIYLAKNNPWKYTKNHLIVLRTFTSKIRSMSTVMGVLSILFLLAKIFIGVGISSNLMASKSIDLNNYDILILHKGEKIDFTPYEDSIDKMVPVKASHGYEIYTDSSKTFHKIRDQVVIQSGYRDTIRYTEFLNDTYMRQSDYLQLRQMLGFEQIQIDKNAYYIHCLPALQKGFIDYMLENVTTKINGRICSSGKVFTEPFSQNDAYGNGQDYIVIIPDEAAEGMNVLYSLYAAITDSPLNSVNLQQLTSGFKSLVILNRGLVVSESTSIARHGTSIHKSDVDYISGKWAQKELMGQMYSLLICLFYLALILEITGGAILATQVLSDSDKKRQQNNILRQLGMSERKVIKLGNRQLFLLFVLPIIPAGIMGITIIYFAAQEMMRGSYSLPIFPGNLWIYQTIGLSVLFFIILYGFYYVAARMSYEKL